MRAKYLVLLIFLLVLPLMEGYLVENSYKYVNITILSGGGTGTQFGLKGFSCFEQNSSLGDNVMNQSGAVNMSNVPWVWSPYSVFQFLNMTNTNSRPYHTGAVYPKWIVINLTDSKYFRSCLLSGQPDPNWNINLINVTASNDFITWYQLYYGSVSGTGDHVFNVTNYYTEYLGGSIINMTYGSPVNSTSFNYSVINFNSTVNSSVVMNCSLMLNDTVNQTYQFGSGYGVLVNFTSIIPDGKYNYYIRCGDGVIINTSNNTFFVSTNYPFINSSLDFNNSFCVNHLSGQFNTSSVKLFGFNASISGIPLFVYDHINSTSFTVQVSHNVSNLSQGYHNVTYCASDGYVSVINARCVSVLVDKLVITDYTVTGNIEGETALFNLSIVGGGEYTSVVTLNYSGSLVNLTNINDYYYKTMSLPPNSAKDQLYNYSYEFTISNTHETITNSTNSSTFAQYMMVVSDCGTSSNMTAINFSFYDEDNPDINSTAIMSGYISVWMSGAVIRNYSIYFPVEAHNHSLCLYPYGGVFNSDGYADYYNSSSTTKRYNINGSLSNMSRDVKLFMSSNSTPSPIIISVVDKDGFPIQGVLIRLQRWYSYNTTYSEVNQLTTDFQGQARFYAYLYTVEYRYLFEYPEGNVITTTDKAFIISTTPTYQLIIGDRFLEEFLKKMYFSGNISYNNLSRVFEYNYSSNNEVISYACLNIYEGSMNYYNSTNSSCLITASGNIRLSVPAKNNTDWYAEGVICAYGKCSLISAKSVNTDVHDTDYGRLGIFAIILLTLLFSLGFIVNPSIGVILVTIPTVIGSYMHIIRLPLSAAFIILVLGVVIGIIIEIGGKK